MIDFNDMMPQTSNNEEENKRLEQRNQEKMERMQKIQAKSDKELELRNNIKKEAADYMLKFQEERLKKIQENHQKLLEQEKLFLEQKQKGGSANPWEKVNSQIDVKEGDYKGSKNVSRMKEIIMNKKNDGVDNNNNNNNAMPFF